MSPWVYTQSVLFLFAYFFILSCAMIKLCFNFCWIARYENFTNSLGRKAIETLEGCKFSGCIIGCVKPPFCWWDPGTQFLWFCKCHTSQLGLQTLVNPFCLSIRLGMVCSAHVQVEFQVFKESLPEIACNYSFSHSDHRKLAVHGVWIHGQWKLAWLCGQWRGGIVVWSGSTL